MSDIVGIPILDLDAIVEELEKENIEPTTVVDTGVNFEDNEGWTRVSGKKHSKFAAKSPSPPSTVKITMEDVKPELDYWSTTVICYVLGGSPPWEVLNRFINRILGVYRFDKISFLLNGLFLVHFPTLECKNLVLQEGFPLFYSKPIIVKPWTKQSSLTKEIVPPVPLWKSKLGYAHLMIEVKVNQHFPDKICFKDEKGEDVWILVKYEWKPEICANCRGIGHSKEVCRKKIVATQQKMVWRPKPAVVPSNQPVIASPAITPVQQIDKPFGGPTIHNYNWITPSPVIMRVRQEHQTDMSMTEGSSEGQLELQPPDEGGPPKLYVTWNEIRDFRQCVDYCEVQDISAHGAFFTWTNKQDPSSRVFSRIDRMPVNRDWYSLYPDCNAYSMSEGLYDHNPCVCYRRMTDAKKKTQFKYFNMWSNAPEFKDIIKKEWNIQVRSTKMYRVVTKLKHLKQPLKALNRQRFSDVQKAAGVAKQLLTEIRETMHSDPLDHNILQAEQVAASNYKMPAEAQFSYLKQKAKIEWLREGDENSAFFHCQIKARQMTNKIFRIVDRHGVTHTDNTGIESAFLDYYQDPLGTHTNNSIVHGPTVREGNEVSEAVLDFFQTGKLLKQLNCTTITLIPKVNRPVSVHEFKPIACCNIVYKCIAKLLCNSLGQVLPDIVSCNQGAFIKGRTILENVLICQDLVRLYKRRSASPRCLLKIDLRKAYDTVEWGFVQAMLQKLNFPTGFIVMLMTYISSPSYSLALNVNNFGFFKGQRGLRQGDPLSPPIFTLCMEYLSRILAMVSHQDSFKYHPLCNSTRINNLIFADDLLLFCKGTELSIMWLLRAFPTFSVASGLKLNKD
ncbi:uncharacterized protein LOC141617705 [Silene latifolia]|uniref:uncharacterized protein LOC141617705 n=1 Tax=Silene latifolia TaxID=37657 RepID=UPI003D783B8D